MTAVLILDNEILTLYQVIDDAERVYFCVYIKDELPIKINMDERCVPIFSKSTIEL